MISKHWITVSYVFLVTLIFYDKFRVAECARFQPVQERTDKRTMKNVESKQTLLRKTYDYPRKTPIRHPLYPLRRTLGSTRKPGSFLTLFQNPTKDLFNVLSPIIPPGSIFPPGNFTFQTNPTRIRRLPPTQSMPRRTRPPHIWNYSIEIIPYEGVALYDPNDEKECILGHEILQQLYKLPDNHDMKTMWFNSNRHLICDFTRFHRCASISELLKAYEGDTVQFDIDTGTSIGVCRCFQPWYILVEDTCHLPEKAECGVHLNNDDIYPVKAWKNAPSLLPKCAPGSVCMYGDKILDDDTPNTSVTGNCQCREGYHVREGTGLCANNFARTTTSVAPLLISVIIITLIITFP